LSGSNAPDREGLTYRLKNGIEALGHSNAKTAQRAIYIDFVRELGWTEDNLRIVAITFVVRNKPPITLRNGKLITLISRSIEVCCFSRICT
jgi:hypothetical protein